VVSQVVAVDAVELEFVEAPEPSQPTSTAITETEAIVASFRLQTSGESWGIEVFLGFGTGSMKG
jgi:hypothetical protein